MVYKMVFNGFMFDEITFSKVNVAYSDVCDVLQLSNKAIELARAINATDVITILNNIQFTHINKGAYKTKYGHEAIMPFDLIEVKLPIYELYDCRRKLLQSNVITSTTFELVGLLQYMVIGLESSDMDCSEDTIYFTVQ